MDYDKLRKYIASKLMERTLAWNAKVEAYPVKPQGLNEQQQVIWSMLVNGNGVKGMGNLSDMETRAMRNTLSEALGVTLPDGKVKELSDIPPYTCLTLTTERDFGIAGVGSGRIVMKKLSGPWVAENARTVVKESFPSNLTRLPTVEEISDMVTNIPDDKLSAVFVGVIPFPASEETVAYLKGFITTATEEMFASRPTLELDEKTIEMYKLGGHVDSDARAFILHLMDAKWDTKQEEAVRVFVESKPAIKALTCVTYKKKQRLFISVTSALNIKGEAEGLELSWSEIDKPDEKHIDKLLKEIPLSYLIPFLPPEMREKMLEEVKLE